ncbi:DUF1349 domain-containing protein [Pseudomonas sp. MOB-449]|nr:DUF1349 domain-containing protein [Pseudomonas sp. MOB-449]
MFEGFQWHNEPVQWSISEQVLKVTTDANTDFWRETHYGFTRDTGHFFSTRAGQSFTAQVRISARFEELYDQAGLMVRVSESKWIKVGVEINDEELVVSTVLTNGVSDWATSSLPGSPRDIWLRVTVDAGAMRVQVSTDGIRWPLVRLAPFPIADAYLVGPMCCTPERAGLEVCFSDFQLGPASKKALHDLT